MVTTIGSGYDLLTHAVIWRRLSNRRGCPCQGGASSGLLEDEAAAARTVCDPSRPMVSSMNIAIEKIQPLSVLEWKPDSFHRRPRMNSNDGFTPSLGVHHA